MLDELFQLCPWTPFHQGPSEAGLMAKRKTRLAQGLHPHTQGRGFGWGHLGTIFSLTL